ncbi:MAG: MFS transporter [Candidatus Coatesbacteria bacterium]
MTPDSLFLEAHARRRNLVLLAAAIFLMSLGLNVHMAMNVNYLHDLLKATSWQQGYLESARESLGVCSFFFIALLAGRSEPRVAAIMLAITGLGLASYSRLDTVPQVIAVSMFWSFGFHIWAPMSGSMALGFSRQGQEGRTMGSLGSVGALGMLASLAGVWLLRSVAHLGMRDIFLIGGALTALGAVPLLLMAPIKAPVTRPMPFRVAWSPRFRLYAGLELLDGMRRQIFSLFAVLALVQEYGVRVETVAALMFANQLLCLPLAPLAGWLVDRVGSKRVLTAYFAMVALVCLLYASITDVRLLFAIYMLDNALFMLRVGVAVYANSIVRPGERTRLMALGTTMNHIGAVALPAIGGALYATYGYRLPFYAGACIAVVSVALVQRMPARRLRVQ